MDLLALSDLDAKTLEQLALRAIELSRLWERRAMPQALVGHRIGSIVELPGWRNPTALALGVEAMGGTCVTVTASLEGSETIEDLAGYLDNWFDLIAVRTPRLGRVRALAEALDAPVMNLRTNDNHPCEILGDLAFVASRRGSWEGLRVAVFGPCGNIAASWVEAAKILPIEIVQVAPADLALPREWTGQGVWTTEEPGAAKDADVIVTDCWPLASTEAQKSALSKQRISAAFLDTCRDDVLFIPCPPVTRGNEVTDDAMRHPRCTATDAKAYLLHTQNAVLEACSGQD